MRKKFKTIKIDEAVYDELQKIRIETESKILKEKGVCVRVSISAILKKLLEKEVKL